MSDEQDLLRAVLEAPHDNLPRLIYADRAQEAGDEDRAEFIRTQIELYNHTEWISYDGRFRRYSQEIGSRAIQLERVEKQLLRENWKKWVPQIAPGSPHTFRIDSSRATTLTGDGHYAVASFERGFVVEARMPLKAFIGTEQAGEWVGGLAKPLFMSHPVERVTLHNTAWSRLFEDGSFRRGVFREFAGPLWQFLFPDSADVEFVEMDDSNETDRRFSEAAMIYGRRSAGLSLPKEAVHA